jgi:transposase-like protein
VEKNDQGKRSKFGCRFDEEFKRDAVRMLESGVRSMRQLSQELGVSVWSLGRWSKLYGKDSVAGGTSGGGGG